MSEEPETPVETPEDDTGAHEGEDEAPAPRAQVEPRLGFTEFVAASRPLQDYSAAVRAGAAAALRRFMRRQHLSPDGYYTLTQWQAQYQACLAHS